MLVLKKELSFYDFMDEFSSYLEGVSHEGISIIYDALCDVMYEGNYSVIDVRDYLRFQLQVMDLKEVIHSYGYDMELQDLEDDALVEVVEEYLNYNTYLLGMYEEDGITFFIFDEF